MTPLMIVTWNAGAASHHMDDALLVQLGPIVRRHPWWQARARLILALLNRRSVHPPARVLDAGCGWGVTLDALERAGYRAVGLDVARSALERIDRSGRQLIEADLTQPLPAIDDRDTFDAVLALDVLEHLDDDREAVARLGRLLRPAGTLVVSVPALPELYGEFDAVQGHRRRYLPENLAAVFEDTGTTLEETFWWGGWMLPVLRRQRRRPRARLSQSSVEVYRSYLRLPVWPIPAIMKLAFRFEQPFALRATLKRGTSLFAVARRTG